MLLNEGDSLLIESPTYVGSLAFLKPLGVKFVQVETDGKGIIPSSLSSILSNWSNPSTKPKVLYTIPTGSNPTGVSATIERKKEILEVCRRENIVILEDDPYYYLYVRMQTLIIIIFFFFQKQNFLIFLLSYINKEKQKRQTI